MALGSIAPLTCTPLLRGLPATARTSIIRRSGFSSCKGAEGVSRGLSGENRRFSSSPKISPLGVLRRRAEQLRVELRLVRGKSSFDRQGLGVADGEDSRSTNSKIGLLILYSKPGCCLCDGLKEKLEGSDIFSGIQLEVRDITTNSEWWNLYQYEIPVLARVGHDGIEEALPRLSPRLSADQVQKKILTLMTSAA